MREALRCMIFLTRHVIIAASKITTDVIPGQWWSEAAYSLRSETNLKYKLKGHSNVGSKNTQCAKNVPVHEGQNLVQAGQFD